MASETVLKELFEVAKSSKQFSDLSEDSVWKACLTYKDRPDKDIKKAMENITNMDTELKEQAKERRVKLEKTKERMAEIKEEEKSERDQERINADKVLEEHFDL